MLLSKHANVVYFLQVEIPARCIKLTHHAQSETQFHLLLSRNNMNECVKVFKKQIVKSNNINLSKQLNVNAQKYND